MTMRLLEIRQGLWVTQAFLLPVMREMGTPRGHARQSSLETRLALIAAAPWKHASGGVPLASSHGKSSKWLTQNLSHHH